VPLDRGPLEQIPVSSREVTVYYRHVWIPPDGSQPNPLVMRPREGRWPTNWTLYTATTPAVAWAEYCRGHPRDIEGADPTGGVGLDEAGLVGLGPLELEVAARALFELDLAFDSLADLTSPWATELLTRAGFDRASFRADPPGYGDCPELAALAESLGWQAIVVPSAAWAMPDGFCVPVFDNEAYGLEQPREAIAAARPSVATAAATTYAGAERPRWLN
jgi:hypothetical protein